MSISLQGKKKVVNYLETFKTVFALLIFFCFLQSVETSYSLPFMCVFLFKVWCFSKKGRWLIGDTVMFLGKRCKYYSSDERFPIYIYCCLYNIQNVLGGNLLLCWIRFKRGSVSLLIILFSSHIFHSFTEWGLLSLWH